MKKVSEFPFITEKFLSTLSKNNNKEWFEANRERFNLEFLQPAIQFVGDVGERLSETFPEINAIPKIDKSIFRLHRDVRFSKDKSPYKTNLGVYFWEGRGKKMESPGFYFHIEPKNYFVGAGMYVFTKEHLNKYREVVANPSSGQELSKILSSLKKKKFSVGGKSFKKVPRGFDPDYKFGDLLLHSGLYVFTEGNDLSVFNKKDVVDFAVNSFLNMTPLHTWLHKNIVK